MLIGIDVSKDKHDACVMVSSGRMLKRRFCFENTKEGYESLVRTIGEYQHALKPSETVIGLETTGNYMTALAAYLSQAGFFVVQVSSFVTKRNRDTLDLSWNKNDVKDARNVADCMKQGKILYYEDNRSVYGNIRRLMAVYNRLSKERGQYRVRLRNNVLCITFPEFDKVYSVVSELVPLTILERYPLPADIAIMSEKEFMDDVRRHSNLSVKLSKLRTLYQLSKVSVGSCQDEESLRWETLFMAREIKRIKAEQENLLERIQGMCRGCGDYELLQTIPGVGPVIGAAILAEVGDIDNFRSSKQLLKLAGLDLSRIESGKFQGDVHISRCGRPLLRSMLYQAGLVAVRNDTRLQKKYLDLVSKYETKRGSKRKFVVAIACKIMRIVYAVLKNKEPYRKEFGYEKPEVEIKDSVIMAV